MAGSDGVCFLMGLHGALSLMRRADLQHAVSGGMILLKLWGCVTYRN